MADSKKPEGGGLFPGGVTKVSPIVKMFKKAASAKAKQKPATGNDKGKASERPAGIPQVG